MPMNEQKKKFSFALWVLVFLLPFSSLVSHLSAEKFSAKAIAIYNPDTNHFLLRRNSTVQRAPASTIKVLTVLTAWHAVKDKNRYVTVSKWAASMQPTKAGLRAGEQYKIIDLMKAALIHSCNDAASALASSIAGSESAFAKLMQKKAKELGCTKTVVTNGSGLPSPPGMVTTCEDSIKLMLAFRKVPELRKLLAIRHFSIISKGGRKIYLKSHNRLLAKTYPLAVRGKTGYTRLARHCFLSYCTSKNRTLVISIMGSGNRSLLWEDVKKAYETYLPKANSFLPSYMGKNKLSLAKLHVALKNAGYALTKSETFYGSRTKEKVKQFQKAYKLETDGIAGPKTWSILKKFL